MEKTGGGRGTNGVHDPEPPKLYEQMVGESSQAYRAFAIFRDMDPDDRSLHAAYRRHNGYEAALRQVEQESDPSDHVLKVAEVRRAYPFRASGRWQEWYHHFGWADRARAFDEENDRQQLARRIRQRRDLRERKVSYGRLLIGRAVPALNGIQPQNLTWQDGLVLLNAGLKLESEGLGDTMDTPEGAIVAEQEESYVDRIHRLKHERGLVLLDGGQRSVLEGV